MIDIKTIKSKDNSILKLVRGLSKKRHRDLQGCFVMEGAKLVKEAIDLEAPIIYLLVRQDYFEQNYERQEALFCKFANADKLKVIEKAAFNSAVGTVNSQGIIAIIEKPTVNLNTFSHRLYERRIDGNRLRILILDRIQDPGNVGTMVRTALGAGYNGIIMLKGCADLYNPKIIRSTGGAILKMPVVEMIGVGELKRFVDDSGIKMVATAIGEDSSGRPPSKYLEKSVWEGKVGIGLVMGNEGGGVAEEILLNSHERVYIPMEAGLESLNVAVAAGILMYASQMN